MWELKLSPIPINQKKERPKRVPKEKKICALDECNNKVKYRALAAKYCSQGCYVKDKAKRKPTIPCRNCGNKFSPNRNRKFYCSVKCFHQKIKIERICQNQECGKIVSNKKKIKKYCSLNCYKTVKQKGVVKYYVCQNTDCGKDLVISQIRAQQKYCCHDCYLTIRKKENLKNIGSLITLRKRKEWEYPRRFIKAETGWMILARYTWEKENGPIPLGYHIGYKDGDTFNDQDVNNLFLIKNSFKKKEEQQESF